MSDGIIIREIKGNLFTSPSDCSLAHCVTVTLTMRAGIANEFRLKFGRIQELKDQKVQVGGVAVLKHESRYIYNLVTKKDAKNKPTYDDLKSSLTAMKDHMVANGVTKLAIPKLGCGIDRLERPKVKDLLYEVFDGEAAEIIVYSI